MDNYLLNRRKCQILPFDSYIVSEYHQHSVDSRSDIFFDLEVILFWTSLQVVIGVPSLIAHGTWEHEVAGSIHGSANIVS